MTQSHNRSHFHSQLASWVELGLSFDNVVERHPNGTFPLVAYSGPNRSEVAVIHEQLPLGKTIPLHHVCANILGLAWIGKVGSVETAWRFYIEGPGLVMLDECYLYTMPFLEELGGMTQTEAHSLLDINQGCPSLPAVEIVKRLRLGLV